eukprot:TRINITY_DN12574_c4_g10_i1.p1 TRINITY_DN12574_c4_g10~~TRINITY_DN12574_c4_g10_i1.p1  ORF type:complete len:396 (+),score=36.12 TRINITY_DN12574_c4_g10_i1:170-1357(+)
MQQMYEVRWLDVRPAHAMLQDMECAAHATLAYLCCQRWHLFKGRTRVPMLSIGGDLNLAEYGTLSEIIAHMGDCRHLWVAAIHINRIHVQELAQWREKDMQRETSVHVSMYIANDAALCSPDLQRSLKPGIIELNVSDSSTINTLMQEYSMDTVRALTFTGYGPDPIVLPALTLGRLSTQRPMTIPADATVGSLDVEVCELQEGEHDQPPVQVPCGCRRLVLRSIWREGDTSTKFVNVQPCSLLAMPSSKILQLECIKLGDSIVMDDVMQGVTVLHVDVFLTRHDMDRHRRLFPDLLLLKMPHNKYTHLEESTFSDVDGKDLWCLLCYSFYRTIFAKRLDREDIWLLLADEDLHAQSFFACHVALTLWGKALPLPVSQFLVKAIMTRKYLVDLIE